MRRLRLILACFGASLFVLTLLAWVRSHSAGAILGLEGRDHTGFVARYHGIFSGGGQLAVGTLRVERLEGLPEENLFVERVPVRWNWRWRREFMPFPFLSDAGSDWLSDLGFGTRGFEAGSAYRRTYRGAGVPYWLLAIVTGAVPAYIVGRTLVVWIRREERVRTGKCVNCGYDLRGTAGRCPECGAAR